MSSKQTLDVAFCVPLAVLLRLLANRGLLPPSLHISHLTRVDAMGRLASKSCVLRCLLSLSRPHQSVYYRVRHYPEFLRATRRLMCGVVLLARAALVPSRFLAAILRAPSSRRRPAVLPSSTKMKQNKNNIVLLPSSYSFSSVVARNTL